MAKSQPTSGGASGAETLRCASARPLLELLLDGELAPEQTLLLEQHIETCGRCSDYADFSNAIKNTVSKVVAADVAVTDAFKERVQLAVQAEIVRESQREREASELTLTHRPIRRSTAFSIVAVAAGALFWLWSNNQSAPGSSPHAFNRLGSRNVDSAATMGVEQTLDRLIDFHSAPPRPQVTNVDLLPTFEPDIGVRIHLPQLARYNAQWEGANLIPVQDRTAASLRYRVLGHHVTVYVYDASKMNIADRLERRVIHNNPVYVGQWRGYNVATTEHRGTGYAAAADLDSTDLEEIVAELH